MKSAYNLGAGVSEIDAQQPTMGQTNLPLQSLTHLGLWPGFVALDRLASPPEEANFFRDCRRIVRSEGVHSDILAWLLNPTGSHGLGDRFACALIQTLIAQCRPRPPWYNVPPEGANDQPLTHIEVATEYPTLRGPIDILIKARRGAILMVIGIENKVDSRLGADQLRRYEEGLRLQFDDKHVLLVYLTLQSERPDPEDAPIRVPWCPVGYRSVVDALQKACDDAKKVAPPSLQAQHGWWLAAQYLSLVRRDLMNEDEAEKEKLCKELYDTHRNAWRVIRSYLPSAKDEFYEAVGQKCCEVLKRQYHGEWHYIVRRNMHADIYADTWLTRFGRYRRDDLPARLWLKANGQPKELAAVHLRVSTEIDDEARALYVQVRLKVRGTAYIGTKDHRLLKAALSGIPKFEKTEWPGSGERTLGIRSSKLKVFPDEATNGADLAATEVAAWVMDHAIRPKRIVEIINKVVRRAKP